MKNTTQRTLKFFSLAAIAAAMAACGGGGGGEQSTSNNPSTNGTSNNPGTSNANAFDELKGSYVVACDGHVSSGIGPSQSSDGSITVDTLVGSDRANFSAHYKDYSSPAEDPRGGRCDPATTSFDATLTGQMRSLGTTKTYPGPLGTPVTAKVVELTYGGFTLSKGSLEGITLPMPNATTKIGYVLDGNKLYLGRGSRDTDGLAYQLALRYGVKQ